VGAGLFVQTLRNARETDVTRDPGRVLLLRLNLADKKYEDTRGKRFYAEVLRRLDALPGVQSVALVNLVPMGGRINSRDIVPRPGAALVSVNFNVVSEGYFQTIGLPLVRGRGFNPGDRENAPGVAVINEQMARRFWPGEDPLGKQFQLQRPPRLVEVIGIVRDGRFRNYRAALRPCFYLPLAQNYQRQMSLEVRAAGNAMALGAAARHEIRALDSKMITGEMLTLQAHRDGAMGQERLSAALLAGVGVLALSLAAIGLYGVLAFSVAQRTREIGLRIALGATRGKVLRSITVQGLMLISTGACLGLGAALSVTRLVSSLLYGITATDRLTYAAATFVLSAVGLAATYLPARRATRIDPMEALRYE
jgi:predicted permease